MSRRRELAGQTAEVRRTTGSSTSGVHTTLRGMGRAHSGGASANAWPEATAVNITKGIGNWSPLSAVAGQMPWVRRMAASSSYQAGLFERGKPTQSIPVPGGVATLLNLVSLAYPAGQPPNRLNFAVLIGPSIGL
jgi:hypothetical protein